jgi:HD-like signal output (HDOD) protein
MRRLLFVDDEQHVLEGLRDATRVRRREWSCTFAASGERALEALGEEHYDVVVSDMRMPVMDGAQLLRAVREIQPDTVRIILSGYAESQLVAQAAPVAHRFLAKPCDLDELASVVDRSLALIDLARNHELRRAAAGTRRLPAVPRIYAELSALLNDPEAGVLQAAALVEQDPAIAGKVLQLANSAFFGIARHVAHVEQAVTMLGLTTLRALVLSTQAVECFEPLPRIAGFSLEALQRKGASIARILPSLLPAGLDLIHATTAALVQNIGLLVVASEDPAYLAEIIATAEREGRPLVDVEYERRGISHAEIGAHLLALWDLPHLVIEAVAYQHRPPGAPDPLPAAAEALAMAQDLLAARGPSSGDELMDGPAGADGEPSQVLPIETRHP